jgi:cellobiose phosphorylase
MHSAYKHLVRQDDKIIQLFNPPFDKSNLDPGYIKGYVPGVRENGGQYTHAAIWLVMAFAAMGNREKTWQLLQMINPVNHGNDTEAIAEYKVEPYVVAADVYGETLNKGRGGWTWYTGSAGWLYQLIIESVIGLQKEGDTLVFKPCLPTGWPSVKITYRFNDTIYNIELMQVDAEINLTEIDTDGQRAEQPFLQLTNDGATHEVKVTVKEAAFTNVNV